MDGQEGGHVDQRRYFYVTLFARDLLLKRFKELKEEEGLALEEVTGAETGGPWAPERKTILTVLPRCSIFSTRLLTPEEFLQTHRYTKELNA